MRILNNKFLKNGSVITVLILFFSLKTMAVEWPGSGDCSGTLQACINAQPNPGSITVKTNAVIAETALTIDKGLNLSASSGFKPIFRNMDMEINVPNNQKVTVEKFKFELSSDLFIRLNQDSEINILSNSWSNPDSTSSEKEGITVYSENINTLVNIKHNTIISQGYNGPGRPLIQIAQYSSGLLKANIHNNILTKLDTDPDTFSRLLHIQNINTGTIDAQVVANTMRGSINPVFINQTLESSATINLGLVSNLITGVIDKNNIIDANPNNTAIKSEITIGNFTGIIGNNTIDGVNRASGNIGKGLDFSGHTTTGSSSINIFNNIIVNTNIAYNGPSTGTSSSVASDGNNIFFNHGSISGLSLDISDLNTPPFFVEEGINYALESSSQAIDIVSSTGTSLLYGTGFMTGSPAIDADGMRRFKGASIDAGAYEWGDRHIFHKVTSPFFNSSSIGDSDLDSNPNAVTIVTQVLNYLGNPEVFNNQAIGIYRDNSVWNIFNQDTSTAMPVNAKFHVYYPYGSIANSLNGLAVYRAINDSVSGFELDDALLNNNPSAGVFVTNLWDQSEGGVYNNHPLEIGYQTANGKWYLNNADDVNMPMDARFNIYSQDGSRNVFHHDVSAENSQKSSTRIDHPLLDNNPCALPMVTQSTTWFFGPLFGQNPHNIGVYYFDGHWRIFNQNLARFELPIAGDIPGGRLNVMVDPQQVYQCKKDDLIFEDGFE